MIHRVIYGSIERFFGILVEHFAGKFPLWMAPIQVAVLSINDDLVPYANEIKKTIEGKGLHAEVDNRPESLNKKIRDAQLNHIPLILTIGTKEKESGTLSYVPWMAILNTESAKTVFLILFCHIFVKRNLNWICLKTNEMMCKTFSINLQLSKKTKNPAELLGFYFNRILVLFH